MSNNGQNPGDAEWLAQALPAIRSCLENAENYANAGDIRSAVAAAIRASYYAKPDTDKATEQETSRYRARKRAKAAVDAADEAAEAAAAPALLEARAVDGAWLEAQRFAPLRYAVPDLLPEGLGVLVAPPKKGKSFLVADFGLAVANGGIALGALRVAAAPVLYLALEDGHRRLRSRFHRLLHDAAIPAGMKVIIKATPGEAITMIREYLAEQRDAGKRPLVIVDTFGKIKPAKHPGEDAYVVDYRTGSALKEMVDAVPGSTLLLVHHTRKAESVDFVDGISGTQGLAGSVDFVLSLERKRHSHDAILSATGRDIIEAEYALVADDGILWRLDGHNLAESRDAVETRRAADRMGDRMMDVFRVVDRAAEAVGATEVAGALPGMDAQTAGAYLRRLAARDYIAKVGRGRYMKSVSEVSETPKNPAQGTK